MIYDLGPISISIIQFIHETYPGRMVISMTQRISFTASDWILVDFLNLQMVAECKEVVADLLISR